MSAMMIDSKHTFEGDNWADISKRILGFSSTYEVQQDLGLHDNIGPTRKARIDRDRLNHRVIEKKRRDRMNNCLADLSRLIPSVYTREGQGRIEKTEVIEMAIKHIVHLQQRNELLSQQNNVTSSSGDYVAQEAKPEPRELFSLGFKNCQDLVVNFLCNENSLLPSRGDTSREEVFSRLVHYLQLKSNSVVGTEEVQQKPINGGIATAAMFIPRMPYPEQHRASPTTRPRYESTSCGSESGYNSDALAQTASITKMSPWTSGGHLAAEEEEEEEDDGHTRCETLSPGYKFKSDIHLRFKADEKDKNVEQASPPILKRAGFVLHQSGNYYVPIHVPEDMLSSMEVTQVEGTGVCHPISISVNLQNNVISSI